MGSNFPSYKLVTSCSRASTRRWHSTTSRSTWSSTQAMSISPCLLSSTEMTRPSTALLSFFKKSSDEEREHGMKLMEYQTKRGGKVVFQDIAKPSSSEWGSPL